MPQARMLCQPSTGHHSTASALNSVSTTCSVRVRHGAAISDRAHNRAGRPRAARSSAPGRGGERRRLRPLPVSGAGRRQAGPCTARSRGAPVFLSRARARPSAPSALSATFPPCASRPSRCSSRSLYRHYRYPE